MLWQKAESIEVADLLDFSTKDGRTFRITGEKGEIRVFGVDLRR